ncbi:methyltransferase domain-containing protein [Desulfitobacterium sp.]|uniref:methyltransferase domain-containing protein n=1 Tax=Desulfitobacterium sp. TaxID=49981 RepID=UPI002B207C13|nr:methyltransferase domain-containing protein [Desulfitobacterium sp.]MEA4900771.1 methyltransferase domain-containing protein [Desulfitobacterium sp.]
MGEIVPIVEIVKRYTEEDKDANLSCGGNIQYLNLKEGEKVLDLGCGRGGETIEAAKRVGPKGFAWGLDLTPRMIDLAKERAQKERVKNAKFIMASMDQIPFEHDCLDAVLSNCAINHVEDKAAVYREIHRVLKQGGRFIVSDIMTEKPLPREIREDPEAIAECFGGAITVQEYGEALSNAGFTKIEVFKERRYLKNGYEMISRTFQGYKE